MIDNNKKGFIVMAIVLLATIVMYLTRFGGDNYIFLTDFLAVFYSFSAAVLGIYAVRIYSLKSLQGKTLFLIVLGIASWFLAELIWIIFSQSVRYYSELLRFLGYIPLILAFFSVSSISDPELRKQRKKFIYLFIIFLIFAIIYLNIIPVVFGGASLLENVLNNGYIVADFVLLFGIFLLVKTSLAFKKGSLSIGWLIIAIAFIPVFIFDVYFAFNFSSYLSGDIIEIFWLSTYIVLGYGFFYQNQLMKDFLRSTAGIEKQEKKSRRVFLITIIAITILLLTLYLLFSFITHYFAPQVKEVEESDFIMVYRDDTSVIFTKEVLDKLNNEYSANKGEYLFCLIGDKINNEIYVNDLIAPELFHQGEDVVISHEDPACQTENSLGSIHSHINGDCKPSQDDIFSWGEMKNPEPIINAIHCDTGIYILVMPGEHEALDFRAIKWEVR